MNNRFVSGLCADPRGVEMVTNLSLRLDFEADVIPNLTDAGFIGKFVSDATYREACFERIEEARELGANAIVLGGHQECHRNPVDDHEQIKQIIDGVELVHDRFPDFKRYLGVFLTKHDAQAATFLGKRIVLPWDVHYVFDSEGRLRLFEVEG